MTLPPVATPRLNDPSMRVPTDHPELFGSTGFTPGSEQNKRAEY